MGLLSMRLRYVNNYIYSIMQKTFFAIFAMVSVALAGAPEWVAVQTDPTHVTYTTIQTGSFDFDSLGDASISNGESFSITMEFYAVSNPFRQGNALSFLAAKNKSTNDLYDISGGDNQFRFYVRPGDGIVNFNVNGWTYGHGADAGTSVSDYHYTAPAPGDVSATSPVKFGLTFTYVNSEDATDGNNYFTLSPTADSQIQFSTLTDGNIVRAFNFSDLTNYTGNYNNAPQDMVTTISITKEGVIPEPATATLSLLALAGLAVRRRRK